MNLLKLILILIGLGLGVVLFFWLLGFIYSILWILFWVGLIGVGGYAGYKFFLEKDETPRLEEKTPISIADTQDADRALEEYKRKYLHK